MKPEEQRIAIAEACGLTGIPDHGQYGYRKREGMPDVAETIPDYLNDLNAMHEAEKALIMDGAENQLLYTLHLDDAAHPEPLFHATAAQRAKAFLKTIGKWTDQ